MGVYTNAVFSRLRSFLSRQFSKEVVDPIDALSDTAFLYFAYKMVLNRPPDEIGLKTRLADLEKGSITRDETLDELRQSPELKETQMQAGGALHMSRTFFIRSLPRADRILDLGGVSLQDPRGAMVTMGYPYHFTELVIVDLPDEQRHPLYQTQQIPALHVDTEHGPVRYEYHSMTDLSRYDDGSFDMVYSGQSFEHITREEGRNLLQEIRRVLRPGGTFAIDTPNRAATEVELAGTAQMFIDPDHKVEYHHAELVDMFKQAGFEVSRSHGLNLVDGAIANGQVNHAAMAERPGLFDAVEECYLVAYVLKTPTRE